MTRSRAGTRFSSSTEPHRHRAPHNTIYTLAEPGAAIGMHMRNYVPDRSIDWTGGVGVPKVELHLADGKG